jgi:high-affinity nickel-transport protein
MSGVGTMTVFILGMRHGADPDHLAAIDNVTRNAHAERPRSSRFTGLFFAAGHSAMVLTLAMIFSMFSSRLAAKAHWLEIAGGSFAVVILLAIAAFNIRALLRNDARIEGVKTRFLPRVLREARNPLAAVPIGMLFGLGFETSSQIAAYGAAFAQGGGALAGVVVGLAFCTGLIVTDALDGFLVHHIVAHRSTALPRIARLWLWCVTLFAVAVAGYELAALLGANLTAQTDLFFGLGMVTVLVLIFAAVYVTIRMHERGCDVRR